MLRSVRRSRRFRFILRFPRVRCFSLRAAAVSFVHIVGSCLLLDLVALRAAVSFHLSSFWRIALVGPVVIWSASAKPASYDCRILIAPRIYRPRNPPTARSAGAQNPPIAKAQRDAPLVIRAPLKGGFVIRAALFIY